MDKHKIIGNNVPNKADSIQINQCHDYYKVITIADQKQSICTNKIENQNVAKLSPTFRKRLGRQFWQGTHMLKN